MIATLWFIAVGFMLAAYAVLDGFDLGVGALHLVVGRTPAERARLIAAIGPVWNGNEVWLLAAGGALVAAFPTVYAASFSGFYLALMLVLWLLILRGLAIEFRHQIDNALWQQAWDVVFSGASLLLALLFGVAVGNVLRGVPLDADGHFQGSFALMLNPFAVLGGLLAVVALAMHGAAYLALKTDGVVRLRARAWRNRLSGVTAVLLATFVGASPIVRPGFADNFMTWPFLAILPLVGLIALVRLLLRPRRDGQAFAATALVVGMTLGSAVAGLYPVLLPAELGSPHAGLDIYNSASPEGSLRIALAIYAGGMALVLIYLTQIYRIWSRPPTGPERN